MTHPGTCPNVTTLERLSLGQLTEAALQALEQHVLKCAACLATLRRLHVEDRLVESLRARASAAQYRQDAVRAERLIKKLMQVQPVQPASAASGGLPKRVAGPEAPAGATRQQYDFLAPPQGPGEIGRLAHYRVHKVLGEGGMGVVFLAEDVQLERPVALKALKPALAASGTYRQRFLREARAAASLKHDHIVTIYEVGEDRGIPFLAMELLEGETLDDRLKRGPIPLAEVLRIGRATAEGLAVAHEHGLIHRDIKPANIWLEHGSHGPARKKTEKSDDIPFRVDPCSSVAAFRVKILDFGLARAAGEQAHLTQTGVVVGTPAYMAPEQARGEAVDHRTDLFSLGCVLYRICTGRMPFQRDNTMALLPSLAADQPPPPRECNPKVPAALSDLVMRLLAEKAADRPESARAVAVALAAIDVGQRGVKPRPSREAEQPGADTCSLPAAAPKRRRPVLIGIAIALLLSGLVAALLYMLFPRHSSVVDVNFITEPYEATILLDGKPVVAPDGTAYRTPCTVSGLPAGVHHISFQLDGFDELDAGDVDLREVREIIARWTRPH